MRQVEKILADYIRRVYHRATRTPSRTASLG